MLQSYPIQHSSTDGSEYAATTSDPFFRESIQKIIAVLSNPSLANEPIEIAATLTVLPLMYEIIQITVKEQKSLLKQMVQEMGAFMGAPGPRGRLLEVAAILFNTKGTNRT